ncbi:MFS transporter [Streptomyces sp. NPDC015171]|uniref:MFS transporter n=1 Tax=Streptomyces sp. NPDC015171 TaxID=3364945 RepID=UPI0036F9A4AB
MPSRDRAELTERMHQVARSRRRTGALAWGLYQDGNDPEPFIEGYLVYSWAALNSRVRKSAEPKGVTFRRKSHATGIRLLMGEAGRRM